ncbi:uncharacterized protein METZ01_LOCUS414393 [marine metagenome]|uniref:Uncharacterized protein n=1 Tax=marine metagenome TaxID=408172 RepID=A0A382WSD8_9ZZZZ
MIQEYGVDLLVVSALDPNNTRHKVEVFRGMEEFQYLSIPPRQRPDHRATVILGDTKNEAIQRAKDYINGQLPLMGF